MHVVARNAQCIERKAVFFLAFLDGIEQHLAAFITNQAKFSIVAANGNVKAVSSLEVAGLSRHMASIEVGTSFRIAYIHVSDINLKMLPALGRRNTAFRV
jgi:hypothetical protein